MARIPKLIWPDVSAEPSGFEEFEAVALDAVVLDAVVLDAVVKDNLPDFPPTTALEKGIALLKIAAEIEHALMVQYLYAGASLVAPSSPGTSLRFVAIEEMGHLATVQNLLVALGEAPYLYRQDLATTDPATRLYPFPLELAPLSAVRLARYAFVEAPENPPLSAADQAVFDEIVLQAGDPASAIALNRVGILYTLLAAVFATPEVIAARATTDAWFREVDDIAQAARIKYGADKVHIGEEVFGGLQLDRQASAELWDRDDESVIRVLVRSVTSADPAIAREQILDIVREIALQGEGATGSGAASHFGRFLASFKDTYFKNEPPTVADVPSGATIPIGSGGISHPVSGLWAELGNLRYHLLLGFLEQQYRAPAIDRLMLTSWCFVEMHHIRQLALLLVKQPRDDQPGSQTVAALPFTHPPADELEFPYDPADGRWPHLHVRRLDRCVELVTQLLATNLQAEAQLLLTQMRATDARTRAEADARLTATTVRTEFDLVREILEWASGTGNPTAGHTLTDGLGSIVELGRFWKTTHAEFLGLRDGDDPLVISGDPTNSVLIERLKGNMPRKRQKLGANDLGRSLLAWLERWIAEGAQDRPLSDLQP